NPSTCGRVSGVLYNTEYVAAKPKFALTANGFEIRPGGTICPYHKALRERAFMFNKLWAVTVNSFTETIRQPIYGVLVLVTVGLLVFNVGIAGYTLEDDNKLLKDL